MNLILLGAPGAGKGTQAEAICKNFSIPSVSTGNIIREALKSGTELGKKAKSFMDEGKLVPDEIVIGIIKDRLAEDDCKNGFILDGFPRTIPQAEALDKMEIIIDKVIDFEVDDEEIVRSVLEKGLQRLGYQVTAEESGLSALARFQTNPQAFDLVITDQTMPQMSGLQLTAAIRVGGRRWNLRVDNAIEVDLPEQDEANAWAKLW